MHNRRDAYSPFNTSATRAADAYVFHEREAHKGDDFSFWRASISPDGPLWGEVRATPFKRMRGDPGDIEVLSNR